MKSVVVYGDSILKGIVLNTQTGRHAPAHGTAYETIGKTFGLDITNRAHFGYTVREGEREVDRDLEEGRIYEYALIEFGGNDSDFRWGEVEGSPSTHHDPKVTVDEYTKRLKSIIEKLRAVGTKPILMTLPPVCSKNFLSFICKNGLSRERIMSFLGDEDRIYRHQEMYSLAASKLSYELNVPLCDVRSEFLCRKNFISLMCGDGIHPNGAGQLLTACTFYEFLKKNPNLL